MSFTTPVRFLARSSLRRPITFTASRSISLTPFRSSPSKIDSIVESISTLTLLEAAELVTALKTKLNITEVSMPAASAAGAVVGGAAGGAAAEEEVVEKPKEQTQFNVKLEKFDPASKAKVIREVKALMPNMNLVEAKKFVESVPQVVKENLTKEDAEALKQKFMDLGCTVVLE
ncbi:ribosomal protein L7/L12 C-terminal domain-containing protein [Mrakia frigida]|uniref:mitochondrial 54S ribosomal protein bL12m MNP1 n=1 Tax=Mrakia frigida TaxID=29902 RepID=UPI003FCC1482